MKKLIVTIAVFTLCLSLIACGIKNGAEATEGSQAKIATVATALTEFSTTKYISEASTTVLTAPTTPHEVIQALVGEWIFHDGSESLIFNEDGTASRDGEYFEWWYDNCVGRYFMSFNAMVYNIIIKTENGIRFFEIEGAPYYYAGDYDKVPTTAPTTQTTYSPPTVVAPIPTTNADTVTAPIVTTAPHTQSDYDIPTVVAPAPTAS